MKKVLVMLVAGAMLSGVAAYMAAARTTPEQRLQPRSLAPR